MFREDGYEDLNFVHTVSGPFLSVEWWSRKKLSCPIIVLNAFVLYAEIYSEASELEMLDIYTNERENNYNTVQNNKNVFLQCSHSWAKQN